MFIAIELGFSFVFVNWIRKEMLKGVIWALHIYLLLLNVNLDLR